MSVFFSIVREKKGNMLSYPGYNPTCLNAVQPVWNTQYPNNVPLYCRQVIPSQLSSVRPPTPITTIIPSNGISTSGGTVALTSIPPTPSQPPANLTQKELATSRAIKKTGGQPFLIDRCVCTEKQVRAAFIIFMLLIGLLVLGLVFFFISIREVKAWLRQKGILKSVVKGMASQTVSIILDPNDPTNDPSLLSHLDSLESQKINGHPKSFTFVIDNNGQVWAHGKASHLSPQKTTGQTPTTTTSSTSAFPKFQNILDMDDVKGKVTPISNMIRTSKKGGGYVPFRWKKNRLMLCYVYPVSGTNLIVGGAIPIPKGQKIWETKNAKKTVTHYEE